SDREYEHQLQQDSNVAYNILTEQYDTPIWALSRSQQIDGILLELHFPHSNSIQLLRQLKEQMGDRCPPIVVIDSDDAEVAVRAFKNGAADYLVKDRMTPDDLRLSMHSAIENAELRRKLERSQEQFQTSVENMLDCFGIFSAMRDESGQIVDFRIDYLNGAACENNRMPKEMQIGRGLCEVLPAHRESGLFDEYCRLVETAEPLIKDALIYDDSYGEQHLVRAFDIRATKLNDGFVASWRDVTDRKRLELELSHTVTDLQRHEAAIQQLNRDLTNRVAELQSLLDIIPVGIAIADDPSCTQMQNNAYLRQLLGVDPGSNISKSAPADEQPPYRVFQNGQEIPAEDLPMQVAVRLGIDVRDAEFDIVLPNGTVHQLLSYATPLRDDQNQIRGVVGAFLDITERNQDAAALKVSQQRYRELAEAMPQMVWTADATGAVNYWNQRWYEYTGLSEAESMGLAGANTVHPNERDRTLTRWSEAVANGESFEIEYRIRRWDSEYHWFISRAIPTRDSWGQITGWIGTVTDIDNQKRLEARLLNEIVNHQYTEQDLRRGEERLKLAQLAGDAGYWDWEIGTNRIFWSTEYYSLCGLDPAIPPSYENWLASILEIDRERADREVRSALASQQNEVCFEYRIHHSIRGVRWLLAKGQTRFNAAGQLDGMIGFTFDITERKQAEIALRQNQERLDLAMEAAKMGSWDWDIQTGKVNWSTNLEHLFGIASGSFDGQYETVRAMIHPDDLSWVERAIDRAVYEREEYNIEFRFIKPDGTVRWALGLGRVFYDATGNPVTMTGVDMDISERKQVESALRDSEERFRNMADNAPVMIWVTNATGYCTYLNRGWYDFTGQTEETALGFGWLNAVHPEDKELSKNVFLSAFDRQEALRLEYRLRRKDGEYCSCIDAASPWFGEHGELKGYIGSIIDISDRKLAEEALAVNEARLRGFVDAGVIGILYGDIYGNIHEANDELLRIIGYTREDLQTGNLCWIDITPPEYLSLDEQGIAEARANGACTPYEKEYIRKDGSRVPVLIGYSLVGEVREDTVVFILDLSGRKQAEEALRQSEERYRTLFESIDEGFCAIEMLFDRENKPIDYRFLETNPAFEKHTGLTNVTGRRMRELVPNHEDYWFERYGNVARTGTPSRFESRAEAMNRWYDVYAFRFGQPESRKVAVLFNDISDRKLADREREQLLVEEKAARAEAERANRIKDEFLAVLSHELRSPLNPILGWTKLLQMRKFDETKTAQALATIERNARVQTQLIDDLLDVAKILRGKLSLNQISVNLSSVVESAIETVETAAATKSISLHPVLPNIGQVSGDAARLQQIVWNLLSNAIKFTPNGGRVDIQLNRVGNQAEITVRDTGRGISPDFLPHIFESFRQEDGSITRKYGGLGLGLAIVRQLVEAHGGTITADSSGEGLGAAFRVRLPLLDVAPEIQQTDELPPEELDLTGIRVIAVDDDPDVRELLTVLLTQYGAEVLTAASAVEVLANLASFQPNVLVSDIGMPDVDGYTLIQQVRALPSAQGGQIPAIALTAYAREGDRDRAISSGFQRHVTKPLEPEQLVQAVLTLTRSKLNHSMNQNYSV
ncbi:MAG TPA: PAS domain S-box protein, partial [Microcoleaceae cyanobacterium]